MLRELVVLHALGMGGFVEGDVDPMIAVIADECKKTIASSGEPIPEDVESKARQAARIVHRTAEANGVKTPEKYLAHILEADIEVTVMDTFNRVRMKRFYRNPLWYRQA